MDIHLYMWFCVALCVLHTDIPCRKYHKYHLYQYESLNVDSVLKDVGTLSCNEYSHGITHFLMSTDVILVLYMSSTEFALPMFVYVDYHLFRWCPLYPFLKWHSFCHSVRKRHGTPNVWTYYHFLWWHTIFTFNTKK